jgi:outer membrane receptor protein involved in Fe transport
MPRRLVSRRLEPAWTLVLALSLLTAASTAVGQQSQLASRGPRFLLAGWVPGREVDASAAPVLHRRVSLDLTGVTVGEALKEVTRQAALEISYSPRVVPLDRPVSLHAQDITVAAALTEILIDVPVDVSVTAGGGLALVRRPPPGPVPEPVDSVAVAGQVTDSASGSPIVGATVSVEGTRRSVVTDAVGRYRIASLVPGTYAVRARYIGYRPARVLVTLGAGEDATADVALERSAQELDQVVVTGTIVPTEVKALPTPVSVISDEEIARQQPHTVQDLLRQSVPTAVAWTTPDAPQFTILSTRGSSAFSTGAPQMKVFVDGIEVANGAFAGVDPNSIARVEIIRGPQAATLYGSNAIGGVIQLYTKRGDTDITRPKVSAEAGLGMVQTPYPGVDRVLRQQYAASVRGGVSDVSYNLGAGYTHTGDWVPNGELSAQSNPSVYGGIRFTHGIVRIDVSGRHYVNTVPSVFNPQLATTGFFNFSKPYYRPARSANQTIGARLDVAPSSWWQNTVVVGVDDYNLDFAQARPRQTTPADTLLFVGYQGSSRRSIGFNTSVQGSLSSGVSGSFIAGFDHSSRTDEQFSTDGALNTTGPLQTVAGRPISGSRTLTNNTGYFGQAQIAFGDALFLTAGLRADENTDFGDQLGTPVSPRVGGSFVHGVGGATLKLRASYGRAIRPPTPGSKGGSVSPTSIILPSPVLAPERQRGWDAGVDAVFGSRGSLSVTFYDQIAENLIQVATLQLSPVLISQYQNVGRVKNTGIEVEGTLYAGPLQLRGQYGYARSRIEQLAPGYTGDLRVGDQSLLVPKHTAGASASVVPVRGTTLGAGLTYVGSWNSTDVLAFYACRGGTAPCLPGPGLRPYTIPYPGFIKVNANVTQQITSLVSAFVSVDNLTNNQAYERWNLNPVMGRITTVGLRFQY